MPIASPKLPNIIFFKSRFDPITYTVLAELWEDLQKWFANIVTEDAVPLADYKEQKKLFIQEGQEKLAEFGRTLSEIDHFPLQNFENEIERRMRCPQQDAQSYAVKWAQVPAHKAELTLYQVVEANCLEQEKAISDVFHVMQFPKVAQTSLPIPPNATPAMLKILNRPSATGALRIASNITHFTKEMASLKGNAVSVLDIENYNKMAWQRDYSGVVKIHLYSREVAANEGEKAYRKSPLSDLSAPLPKGDVIAVDMTNPEKREEQVAMLRQAIYAVIQPFLYGQLEKPLAYQEVEVSPQIKGAIEKLNSTIISKELAPFFVSQRKEEGMHIDAILTYDASNAMAAQHVSRLRAKLAEGGVCTMGYAEEKMGMLIVPDIHTDKVTKSIEQLYRAHLEEKYKVGTAPGFSIASNQN